MMSRRKSSRAGYRISSIARFNRWISSTKRTSCRSSPVRIAAMSPWRSSAGPATQRMPTPSSSRTMWARLVLPSPGGPTSRTWSSASSRALAAVSAIVSWSLIRSWPTNSARRRGRSDSSRTSSSGTTAGARIVDEVGAVISGSLQRLPYTFLRRQPGIDHRKRLLRLAHGVAELDERVARDQVRLRSTGGGDRDGRVAEFLLQLQHDALRRLLADPRDRLEPCRVLEDDRTPQLRGRRAGHDRERDLRPDAVDGQQLHEQLALRRLGEAVQLQGVLADVQVRVERDLRGSVRLAHCRRRRGNDVANSADVDDETLGRVRDRASTQARDHPAILRSGGASAWQIATASASAACEGVGSASRAWITLTHFCTWRFSARP